MYVHVYTYDLWRPAGNFRNAKSQGKRAGIVVVT